MTTLLRVVPLALLVGGCGQQLVEFALPDAAMTTPMDLAGDAGLPPPDLLLADTAVLPDLVPPVDYFGADVLGIDFTVVVPPPDLAGSDLTFFPDLLLPDLTGPDLITLPDQTPTTDLVVLPDLKGVDQAGVLPDQSAIKDLTGVLPDQTGGAADMTAAPADQTVLADLASLPDQVPPADLNGPRCHAVLFDGLHSLVTSPHNGAYNPLGSLTVEAWVYPTKLGPTESTLVAHWGDAAAGNASYRLSLTATGQPLWRISITGFDEVVTTAPSPLSLNRWSHVAAVYYVGSQTLMLFVNGVQVSSFSTVVVLIHGINAVPLSVGRLSAASPTELPYAGYIDEVRVSTNARYTANFTPASSFTSDASTVALYHYDETSGQTASDSSTTANVATLQLNAAFASPPVCQ